MPISEIGLEAKIKGLLRKLSPNQAAFLEMRRTTSSDAEACRLIGIETTTASRWKKNQDFFTAYVLTTQVAESQKELIVADQNKQAIVRAQMAALLNYLPLSIQRLIDMVLNSKSEEMSIRAIKLLFDTIGMGPQAELPVNKNNQALMNIMRMIAPHAAAEAEKRGLPVEEDLRDLMKSKEVLDEVMPEDYAAVAKDILEETDTSVFDEEEEIVL